jgi:signal transduction histidine kinase/integral membrane sensor domain MASE1
LDPREFLTQIPERRELMGALAAALAYYLGAQMGFILRFPPLVPSIMWPPNAILTAALLLVSPSRWWMYLLAVLPAHLAAQLPLVWMPRALIPWFYLTNCSEALIAAGCVRLFSNAPARLDTLRRVAVFIIGAALAAPFFSSFLDASVVARVTGASYPVVWRTRFFSNVLTELVLPPVILGVASIDFAAIRRSRLSRRLEAALLALLVVGFSVVVFARSTVLGLIPGAPRNSLAFLLPLLLWAATRFGALGVSASFMAATLVAITASARGSGPFNNMPPADSVLALQIFLIAAAIPLMCLAGVIEERQRVGNALAERLRFEQMLARLSAAFVHWPSHDIDFVIGSWLRRLGDFLGIDRVMVLRRVSGTAQLAVVGSWTVPGIPSAREAIAGREFPRVTEKLINEQPFVFEPSATPEEEADDEAALQQGLPTSNVTIPLVASGRIVGLLLFDSLAKRAWPEEQVRRLQLLAEVFGNALARKETEDALRASELMKSAILSSLSSAVAVLDDRGRVIAVNAAWTRYIDIPDANYAGDPVGTDYLEVCRQAVRDRAAHSLEVLAGLQQVLEGTRREIAVELRFPRTGAWFALSIVPLDRSEGGAVVSYTEITERKRAELQAERSRQELAHFTRISTMGELTASIAHELRQPLAGILTNAQAARRFLDKTPPDMTQVRGILEDIIADDRRAAEVIQRLREVLSKGELQRQLLDLNDLIRNVARLLGTDTIIRNVRFALELPPEPVEVSGDRVQLEQVLLNLFVNAMDAMSETPGAERCVLVRSERLDGKGAHVAVEDTGIGLREDAAERLFEPFYTTKPAGMGMGLSVAKSIVEAHGGSIWATNNRSRGATFHFALPARPREELR